MTQPLKVLDFPSDENISFNQHINSVIPLSHYNLCAISFIFSYLTNDMVSTLNRCLVIRMSDYCEYTFHKKTQRQRRLQRVRNKAARFELNINLPNQYLRHFLSYFSVHSRYGRQHLSIKICVTKKIKKLKIKKKLFFSFFSSFLFLLFFSKYFRLFLYSMFY